MNKRFIDGGNLTLNRNKELNKIIRSYTVPILIKNELSLFFNKILETEGLTDREIKVYFIKNKYYINILYNGYIENTVNVNINVKNINRNIDLIISKLRKTLTKNIVDIYYKLDLGSVESIVNLSYVLYNKQSYNNNIYLTKAKYIEVYNKFENRVKYLEEELDVYRVYNSENDSQYVYNNLEDAVNKYNELVKKG